jgi:hypothetical protein
LGTDQRFAVNRHTEARELDGDGRDEGDRHGDRAKRAERCTERIGRDSSLGWRADAGERQRREKRAGHRVLLVW